MTQFQRRFAFKICWQVITFGCQLVMITPALFAEETWYSVPFEDLEITAGEVLKTPTEYAQDSQLGLSLRPRFALDGHGVILAGRRVQKVYYDRNPIKHQEYNIVVQAPAGADVTGRMWLPKEDLSGMYEVRFRISKELADEKHRSDFLATQHYWYQALLNHRVAGQAWFRHRTLETALLRDIRPEKSLPPDGSTFHANGILLGTRSLSNSLALNQLLDRPTSEPLDIDPQTIPGVPLQDLDWDKIPSENVFVSDPLASNIPSDQYAIFFPSFRCYSDLVTESETSGALLLDTLSPTIEDSRMLSLYETQLCLSLGQFAKSIGDQLVGSLAITGTDPYLRGGSEVAVLMQTQIPEALTAAVKGMQQQTLKSVAGCQQTHGEIDGKPWTAVVSPARHISSYVMKTADAVIVANSLRQLQQFVAAKTRTVPAIDSLPEYKHFRSRYRRVDKDETAFLMLPAAAVNQWRSAVDRIASTRRTYAAAVLADETARHMDDLVNGVEQPQRLTPRYRVPGMGPITMTKFGITDATYGSYGFLTPVSELRPDFVGKSEAQAYIDLKNGGRPYWTTPFSGLGVRVSVSQHKVALDMSTLPRLSLFPYDFVYGFSNKQPFDSSSGQRHPESILHCVANVPIALEYIVGPKFSTNCKTAMEGPVSLYFDKSPFWDKATKPNFLSDAMFNDPSQIPCAISVGITDAKRIAEELKSHETQGFIKLSEHQYRGYTSYHRTSTALGRKNGFGMVSYVGHIVILPDSMHVSPNPKMIHSAIDRYVDTEQLKEQGQPIADDEPKWVGSSVGLQLRPPTDFVEGFRRQHLEQRLRGQSWSNLWILNEWKSLYPKHDAVELHERIWKSRLHCPGGGSYVWNEEFQTYESTVFGHPAQQRTPKNLKPLSVYHTMKHGNIGITIEEQGLRVRVEIERSL